MNIAKLMLGTILMFFFLALSIETPSLFSLSAGAEELIQYGFAALALFCMVVGLVKN